MTATRANSANLGHDSSTSKLRVLYVTNQLPFPAHSGGQVRESELIARLGGQVHIHLAVISENFERDASNMELARSYCEEVSLFAALAEPDTHDAELPPRIARYNNPNFGQFLAQVAQQVDLVHVEGYFLMRHLPDTLRTPLLLVAENVESDIERQRELLHPALSSQETLVLSLERAAWKRATFVAAMTEGDAEAIRSELPGADVVVSPNGFDHSVWMPPSRDPENLELVTFVGNFGWEPTRHGAVRLLDSIWPLVRDARPAARLALIGAGMDYKLQQLARRVSGVNVVGSVDSVAPHLAASTVFVCPINFGSGVMMKMMEALRAGCAIVCDPAALRGLPPIAKEAVIVSSADSDFANSVIQLLESPSLREELSMKASRVFNSSTNWSAAAEVLLRLWETTAMSSESLP